MHRGLTVIRLSLMTSRGAASAGGRLLILQRERPLPEFDPLGKHLRERRPVGRMTCYATPPLERAVNMQVVQVRGTVPEVGGITCVGKTDQVPVMAAETQCKLFVIVRHIEIRRKFLFQQLGVNRPVRVVARGATARLDGAVDIRHRLRDDIGMAAETQFLSRPQQKLVVIAGMGRMTGNAAFLGHYRRMLRLRLLHRLLDLRVALETDLGAFRRKHLRVGRTVRIMTRRASHGNGRMYDLLLQRILHVHMACQAKVGLRFQKQLVVNRFMRVMACGAVAGRGRTVQDFMVDLVGMTHQTKVLQRLNKKFVLIGRMRIVTGCAHAVLYGGVNMRLLSKRRMTHVTQRGHSLHQFECLFAFLGMRFGYLLVAGVAACGNGMHILPL